MRNSIFSPFLNEMVPINEGTECDFNYYNDDFCFGNYNFKEEHEEIIDEYVDGGLVYITTDDVDYPIYSHSDEDCLGYIVEYLESYLENYLDTVNNSNTSSSNISKEPIVSYLPEF